MVPSQMPKALSPVLKEFMQLEIFILVKMMMNDNSLRPEARRHRLAFVEFVCSLFSSEQLETTYEWRRTDEGHLTCVRDALRVPPPCSLWRLGCEPFDGRHRAPRR